MKRSLARAAAFAAALAVCLCACARGGEWEPEPVPSAPEDAQQQEAQLPEPPAHPNYTEGTEHPSWSALYAVNRHTIGWLEVAGTRCDNVVVQHPDDNFYYLDYAFDGSHNIDGTLYVDRRCILNEYYLSQNITVYGHNLLNGTMFGQLPRYKSLDFYRENPLIKFDTPYGTGTWKVFAMFLVNTDERYGAIFDYRQPEYDSPEDFLAFIEQVRRRSLIHCPVDVGPYDRILTLSTCSYEIKDADMRFVVMARLVRADEGTLVEVERAEVNEAPLYFDGWYRTFGGSPPVFESSPPPTQA